MHTYVIPVVLVLIVLLGVLAQGPWTAKYIKRSKEKRAKRNELP